MSIPEKIFGRCPICSGAGENTPASELTGADSTSNIVDTDEGDGVVGIELIYFRGDLMCHVCRQNQINREQSEANADKHSDEEDFRASVGFTRTIT